MFRRSLAVLTTAGLVAATATGCSSDSGDKGSDGSGNGPVKVVASTNVYGSIAQAVAGDRADVSSVITDPGADPHSFEASPADAAKITGADLVVYNGAGYDEFVDKALGTDSKITTVEAVEEFHHATGVEVEDHHHEGGEEKGGETKGGDEKAHEHEHTAPAGAEGKTTNNEHVWYSLATAAAVAEEIAAKLGEKRPADKDLFTANAKRFAESLNPLHTTLSQLKGRPNHATYVQTETIGRYMFEEAGLVDATPAGFQQAIESEQDPSAADFDAASHALTDHKATFLALNTQTETPLTQSLTAAAKGAGVPVVGLTETLPTGKDYVQWMTDQVQATAKAVGA